MSKPHHADTAAAPLRLGILSVATGSVARLPTRCASSRGHSLELSAAAWLRLVTLSRKGRLHIVELMETIADSLEARAQPLGFDLAEESPETQLYREAAWFVPSWNAAKQILRPCFHSADRRVVVLVPSHALPFPDNAQTFEPWGEPSGSALERQARFLSWPISSAVHWRVAGTNPVGFTLEQIRERAERADSSVALVIDSNALLLSAADFGGAVLDRLKKLGPRYERLRRLTRGRNDLLSEWALALTQVPPEAPLLPWLKLGHAEALVVPRLSAALEPERLREEIRAGKFQVRDPLVP